jgi:DNA-binding transcriptional ArsR family regulator
MREPKKNPKGNLADDVHTLLHPVRLAIVEQLAKGPQYISALSNMLGMERRLVTYHLLTLESYGFVKSRREVSLTPGSLGKGLKIYESTPKVAEVKAAAKKAL